MLYLTHFWDEACAREVAGLQQLLIENYDVVAAGFTADADADAVRTPPEVPGFFYSAGDLQKLGYSQFSKFRPYHLILMRFVLDYPDYDQVWMIEYDVRYTGNWAELFAELDGSKADFLATVVQRREENPEWVFWEGLDTAGVSLPEDSYVKVFAPLMRLSKAAIRVVDAAYKAGWLGHYEVLWPVAITAAGLLIEEIGGEGSFTPEDRVGRYYTNSRLDPYLSPGSFVFRPSMLEADVPRQPPMLWHPVKSAEMSEGIPVEAPPTWKDTPWLQPARGLIRRLRHGLGQDKIK